jgi:hypothetical protein
VLDVIDVMDTTVNVMEQALIIIKINHVKNVIMAK